MEQELQEALRTARQEMWISIVEGKHSNGKVMVSIYSQIADTREFTYKNFLLCLMNIEKAQKALDEFYRVGVIDTTVALMSTQQDTIKSQQDTIDLLIQEITQ